MKYSRSFITMTALVAICASSAYAAPSGLGTCKSPSKEGIWQRENKAEKVAQHLIGLSRIATGNYIKMGISRKDACQRAHYLYYPSYVGSVVVEDLCSSGERTKLLIGNVAAPRSSLALVTNIWREYRAGRKTYDERPQLISKVTAIYAADLNRCMNGLP